MENNEISEEIKIKLILDSIKTVKGWTNLVKSIVNIPDDNLRKQTIDYTKTVLITYSINNEWLKTQLINQFDRFLLEATENS